MTDDLDLDLELLRNFMKGTAEEAVDLDSARLDLQKAIDAETDAAVRGLGRRSLGAHHFSKWGRLLAASSGIAAAAAAALLLIVLLPGAGQHQPIAAAAELSQIASAASSQMPAQLGQGQLLATEEQVSLLGRVTQIGSTQTPNAQAIVNATIKRWQDRHGDSCTSATASPAQFASPVNQDAWKAAGMLDSPNNQPAISCTHAGESVPGGGGAMDASRLPTDSLTLARELQTGTTGIAQLDQLTIVQSANPGFERAAFLLIGPTTGLTPQVSSSLYSALALIPGIHNLGNMTSHSGQAGIAFSGSSNVEASVIIVDPSSGALLEARDIQSPPEFQGLGQAFIAPPPTPSIGTDGGTAGITIQWLDPVGSPTVVDASSLPPNVSVPTPVIYTGNITATANLGVNYSQLQSLENQLSTRFGTPFTSGYSAPSALRVADGAPPTTTANGQDVNSGAVLTFAFTGGKSQIDEYTSALKASGLFSSVAVSYGTGSGP